MATKTRHADGRYVEHAAVGAAERVPAARVREMRAPARMELRETQAYGTITALPNGLDPKACEATVKGLNHLLADTLVLRDLYKKHHWQVSGHTFYQLHLLFDKHYAEQVELVDEIAERVQMLGGVSLAMAPDVVEETCIPRAPRGREPAAAQIARLLEGHRLLLVEAHRFAREAVERGDDGTNDMLVGNVIRTNEMQVWFLAEHLSDRRDGEPRGD